MPYIEQQSIYNKWDLSIEYQYQLSSDARSCIINTYLCPARRGPEEALTERTLGPPIVLPCGCTFPGLPVAGGACADYAGNHGDLSPGSSGLTTDFYWGGNGTGTIISCRPRLSDSLTDWRDRVRLSDVADGTSSTFLVGEIHIPRGKLATLPDNGPAYDGSRFYYMSRVGGPGVPIAQGPDDELAGMGLFAFGSWHRHGCHFAFADGHVKSVNPGIGADVLERLCNRHDGLPILDF
jgi:prepilin-type processing-associated H-X9-DG protein